MTTKLLDIDGHSSPQTQLQFQEFSSTNVGGAAELDVNTSHVLTFNHSPDTPGSDSETGLDSGLISEGKQAPSFWTFEYYQQFFDVDTKRVIDRILWSMIPRPGTSYLEYHVKPKPDLYGPFWICITLMFTIAVSGNLSNYLHVAASHDYHWKYEFHIISYAAVAIFSYAWIVPLILWALLKWRGDQNIKLTFLEILCVYGYSLAIYVPLSIFWVIQVSWIQWLFLVVGVSLSGSVLMLTFWPAIQGDRKFFIAILILGLHILLAASFKFAFFPRIQESAQSVQVSAVHNLTSASNATAVTVSKG